VTSDITSIIPGDQGLHDVTIQGAGMWYTTFVGDPTLYTNQHQRVRFLGGGNNVNLSDFAVIGKLNYRNDAVIVGTAEPSSTRSFSYGSGR
jgi:hypothetical protein